MKTRKKLTVTIGISAYNEEGNIANLLKSLVRQKEKTIRIQKIIVVSDGSTDSTVSIVNSFKNSKVICTQGNSRVGKAIRLNELFSIVNSDVLIIVDADTIFKSSFAIEKLVQGFRQGKNVGVVSGNTQPLIKINGQTFIEYAVNTYYLARNSIEKHFDIGTTAYSMHGFLAYSKEFLKGFKLPQNVLNDDAYSYFICLKSRKWKNVYVKEAIVFNRSPRTVADYVKQTTRYIKGGRQLHQYFDEEFVSGGIKLPYSISLRIMLYQFMKNPLGYIFLKILTLSCFLFARIRVRTYNIAWATISTSKSLT